MTLFAYLCLHTRGVCMNLEEWGFKENWVTIWSCKQSLYVFCWILIGPYRALLNLAEFLVTSAEYFMNLIESFVGLPPSTSWWIPSSPLLDSHRVHYGPYRILHKPHRILCWTPTESFINSAESFIGFPSTLSSRHMSFPIVYAAYVA